jgi:LAGLIDADG endonuclease
MALSMLAVTPLYGRAVFLLGFIHMDEPALPLAWIGGFFDADGSITLSKRNRKRGDRHTVEFVPALHLSQSDPGILEAISRQIGGGVYRTGKRGEGNSTGVIRTRDSYTLRADNAKAISICKMLLPVTFVKRKELEEVIRYYETYNNYTKGWARWADSNQEYSKRYSEMVSQGDSCRARLNLIRQNKDTLDVSF